MSYIFYILKFSMQQYNYQHSFKMTGFFDPIPVKPGLRVGPQMKIFPIFFNKLMSFVKTFRQKYD
jgi:hypothetical protein